jgi:hypothetical protein
VPVHRAVAKTNSRQWWVRYITTSITFIDGVSVLCWQQRLFENGRDALEIISKRWSATHEEISPNIRISCKSLTWSVVDASYDLSNAVAKIINLESLVQRWCILIWRSSYSYLTAVVRYTHAHVSFAKRVSKEFQKRLIDRCDNWWHHMLYIFGIQRGYNAVFLPLPMGTRK